jgi:alkanesulfonate monooxygenase SsuD/methylene tetrahydromethanopterin reductase-like flavin-dependent oxidoreductase (luciferase family)
MNLENLLDVTIASTPEQCVERIQRYVDIGVTYFIPHFLLAQDLEAPRVFVDRVAPAFR